MEIQYRVDGKRKYPGEFKDQILAELAKGATAAELSRQHQIPIQNIVKWRRKAIAVVEGTIVKQARALGKDEAALLAEYRKVVEENKNLRRSLASMTMDRDILKEAVDIAAKKKWI